MNTSTLIIILLLSVVAFLCFLLVKKTKETRNVNIDGPVDEEKSEDAPERYPGLDESLYESKRQPEQSTRPEHRIVRPSAHSFPPPPKSDKPFRGRVKSVTSVHVPSSMTVTHHIHHHHSDHSVDTSLADAVIIGSELIAQSLEDRPYQETSMFQSPEPSYQAPEPSYQAPEPSYTPSYEEDTRRSSSMDTSWSSDSSSNSCWDSSSSDSSSSSSCSDSSSSSSSDW
jgi:hypothetical protein